MHPVGRISQSQRALDGLSARCNAAVQRSLANRRTELGELTSELTALSPLAVLERGFAVVRKGEEIVRDAEKVTVGDRLQIRLARGQLMVVVEDQEDVT